MLQIIGRNFEQTILLVLVAISMVSAVYRTNQIVDLVQNMFYYDELDTMYPETGSVHMKDLFIEFVRKYHKEYFSPEEIRLRYELFKLRVKRDGRYDSTTDMTTKEKDAMEVGHNYDGPRDYDYDNEYGEKSDPNNKERSDNKDKNSSDDTYQKNSITKEPLVSAGGNDITTERNTSPKFQEVNIEMEPNNIKIISAKEPIQMIFNNCTVIIRSSEDFSSNAGLSNLTDNSLGKDELRNETESLNYQPTKKANKSIGQTSEDSNYLQNITKPTQESITSTDINLISNEDIELNSSHPKESVQDSTQAAVQKIDDLTTLEHQNQTNDPYFGKPFLKLVPDNTTTSADNNTEDKQPIRYRNLEDLIGKQVNYRAASGVTTEGIVIAEDKDTKSDNEDNETDNNNEYDDVSENGRKPEDKSLVKDNVHNLLPQYSNKKIINSKYPKFYNIYNINSSVVQI
uniref:Uncharacterized protein n=1 Tax=Cacopsylla melanoneura TaxID=428564 RepID=A0A8D8Z6V5_9HEMI